jgi:hypothetical protein
MKINVITIKSEYYLGTQDGVDYRVYPSENN